ncbi:hypothetical protein E1265_08695 [Streptomyces sp. 8K308]|nr:hypothetical protein E1265_08695 [Streptomyces sp. 8K308]
MRNRTWRDAGANRTVTDVRSWRCATAPWRSPSSSPTPPPTPSSATPRSRSTTPCALGTASLLYIPAVGTILLLPGRLGRPHYYGRGPEENHWDRATGAGPLAIGEPLLAINAARHTPEDLSVGVRHAPTATG